MKVKDVLFEGPYHIDQEQKPVWKADTFTSDAALAREYQDLGVLERPKLGDVSFWLHNGKKAAIVTRRHENDIGVMSNEILVHLTFQPFNELGIKKALQVSQVTAAEEQRNQGLASALYIVLCRYGYSVVSDFTQYNAGKALWKKLASESEARKYVVRIWDDATQDWVKDGDMALKYNAANLGDDKIWHDIDEVMNTKTTLLVLGHD